MRGVSFFFKNFTNLISFLSPFLKKIPIKILPMQIENMVSVVSRSGRHLQRYDSGYRLVVGCIPYRYKKQSNSIDKTLIEDLEVLVISSQNGQSMLFPKGGWENDESMEQAATRETLEEAGVTGNIECKLGEWQYMSKRGSIIHRGHMFPLLVDRELDCWPEKNIRKRRWVTVDEATQGFKNGWMREALDEFVRRKQQKENNTSNE
ncbi:hypothetical protein SLE2022_346800 [Rubroshorea leprosula]